MPRRTSLLAIILFLFGITSCARGPEAVWVDIAAATPAGSTTMIVPAQKGVEPLKGTLDPIEARNIVAEDEAELVRLAIAEIIEDQQELFLDLRTRLFDQLAAEIRVAGNEQRDAIIAGYQKQLATALDKLSAMLAEHARIVGPKWHRIAWLADFPDPDPTSRRRPREGDFIAEQRLAEAKKLREEIAVLQAEFDAASGAVLKDLRDGLRVDEAVLADDIAAQIEAAKAEAEKQAQEAAIAAVKGVEDSALALDTRVEGVPGTTSNTPGISGAPATRWTNPAASLADRERLMALARLYAASNGWKLAEKPTGATNKTKEFYDWLKKRERPGLSANSPD